MVVFSSLVLPVVAAAEERSRHQLNRGQRSHNFFFLLFDDVLGICCTHRLHVPVSLSPIVSLFNLLLFLLFKKFSGSRVGLPGSEKFWRWKQTKRLKTRKWCRQAKSMHCVGRMTLSSLPAARDVSIDVGCFLPLFPLLSPPFTYCFSPAEPPNGPTKPLCFTVFSISFYPFHLCWSDPARPGVALALVLLLRLPARPPAHCYVSPVGRRRPPDRTHSYRSSFTTLSYGPQCFFFALLCFAL